MASLAFTVAMGALREIFEGNLRAEKALERALKAHRGLTSAERGAVARRVLGVACFRRRLDHLLQVEAEPDPALRLALRLAGYLLLEEEKASVDRVLEESGLPGSCRDRLAAALEAPPPLPSDPVAALGVSRSLPDWLAQLWKDQLGVEAADALAAATNLPGPKTLRVNTLKISRDGLQARLAQDGIEAWPTRFAPSGLHLQGRPNIFGSSAWREGLFEMQDEASQLVALLAGPRPGERCVDFCAGKGGKTLALAALMHDEGKLYAIDPDGRALVDMAPRLTRAGLRSVRVMPLAVKAELPATLLESAEVVLVDAPCSALGTLRRGPDLRWRLRPEEVAAFPALQLEILQRAARLVRRGGRLVYATCTVNRAENDDVARRFAELQPAFSPLSCTESLGEVAKALDADEALVLRPDVQGTDGFFAVQWRRS